MGRSGLGFPDRSGSARVRPLHHVPQPDAVPRCPDSGSAQLPFPAAAARAHLDGRPADLEHLRRWPPVMLRMSDEELIALIKENLALQVGYHFKGSFARVAFEANCLLFEEAT